jgi:hypothetical protein
MSDKKYLIICSILFMLSRFAITTVNALDNKKSPSYFGKTKTGEIILKRKKADWIYNCVDCHQDFKTRTLVREMISDHKNLKYQHIRGDKWCFSCHYKELAKRNRILMPEGQGVYRGTQDMIKICKQCHGRITGEWEMNIHGKVTGSWVTWGDQKFQKKTCGDCHSPHHPRSIQINPLPGPKPPRMKQGKNNGKEN